MKNFFLGMLAAIMLIIAWPQISQFVEETAVSQPVTIIIEQPTDVPTARPVVISKPVVQPTAVGDIEAQRAKQHESIKQLEGQPTRRGRE